MLDGAGNAFLTDFGTTSEANKVIKGDSLQYQAPDVYRRGKTPRTQKSSDVFAYGLMLCQGLLQKLLKR